MNLFKKKCFCGHDTLPGFHDKKICVDLTDGIRVMTEAIYNKDYVQLLISPEEWDAFAFWHSSIKSYKDALTKAAQLDLCEKWMEDRYE